MVCQTQPNMFSSKSSSLQAHRRGQMIFGRFGFNGEGQFSAWPGVAQSREAICEANGFILARVPS
jgi:hypothetical protein